MDCNKTYIRYVSRNIRYVQNGGVQNDENMTKINDLIWQYYEIHEYFGKSQSQEKEFTDNIKKKFIDGSLDGNLIQEINDRLKKNKPIIDNIKKDKRDPKNYELKFHHGKDTKIPVEDIKQDDNIKIITKEKYIMYDNFEIRLFDNIPFSLDISDYIYLKKLPHTITKEKILSYIEKHRDQIKNKYTLIEIITSLSIPSITENEWICLLYYNKPSKLIIGIYNGRYTMDDKNRKYNCISDIKINPLYQKLGLCNLLAKYTYNKVINELKVNYMKLSIEAENQCYACQCYVRAALENGFKVYTKNKENKQIEITNKQMCTDFKNNLDCPSIQEYQGVDKLIITKDIKIDDENMWKSYQ